MSVVCFQVEVSASGWSLTQRNPTECGVSECDSEAPDNEGPGPPGAVVPWKGSNYTLTISNQDGDEHFPLVNKH
jgi:hypothetical protein